MDFYLDFWIFGFFCQGWVGDAIIIIVKVVSESDLKLDLAVEVCCSGGVCISHSPLITITTTTKMSTADRKKNQQDQTPASNQSTATVEKETQLASLEDDDEFEDFPAQDWSNADAELDAGGKDKLWEEHWDDDDAEDDFSARLKQEIQSAQAKNVMQE